MNGEIGGEPAEDPVRKEIRDAIDELRAAATEIAYLRRDLAVKDEYIAYLKSRLEPESPPT